MFCANSLDDSLRYVSIRKSYSQTTSEDHYIKKGDVINLKEKGIIDPTKVTRAALENAAAVAGTVLLTECVVVNDPEEKENNQQQMNPMMGM